MFGNRSMWSKEALPQWRFNWMMLWTWHKTRFCFIILISTFSSFVGHEVPALRHQVFCILLRVAVYFKCVSKRRYHLCNRGTCLHGTFLFAIWSYLNIQASLFMMTFFYNSSLMLSLPFDHVLRDYRRPFFLFFQQWPWTSSVGLVHALLLLKASSLAFICSVSRRSLLFISLKYFRPSLIQVAVSFGSANEWLFLYQQ